jgi:GTP cyclohydrolase II
MEPARRIPPESSRPVGGEAWRACLAVDRLRERFHRPGERRGRPFVTLSYAQSLDGSIAAKRGRPLALSGPDALVLTHRLRAAHDVIVIGIGTLLSDDPRLTVRHVEGPDPWPIVLDSRLRTPSTARLLSHPTRRPVIATTEFADASRAAELESAGARVVRLAADSRGRVSLAALLAWLDGEGVASVMVEGGARVITSFLRERHVDHLLLTVASMIVGGLRAVGPLDALARSGGLMPRVTDLESFHLGDDVVLSGAPSWAGA